MELHLVTAVDVTRQVARNQPGESVVWNRLTISHTPVLVNDADLLSKADCWAAEQCCCDRSLLGLTRMRRSFVGVSVSLVSPLLASLVYCF